MKRYRVLLWDFDTRANILNLPINDNLDEHVKKLYIQNKEKILEGLIKSYGEDRADQKKQNFLDLGAKPISIIAFHNHFFQQVRMSFVIEAYYPALTGACALGERILNHLILLLRNDFKTTPEYKKVYRKKSFDDWSLAINTLVSWGVLLSEVEKEYKKLMDMRQKAIHFRPETDYDDRKLALSAIRCLQKIISVQFSGFGAQPWFITDIPGEIYIKKDWERNPFINKVYIPCCAQVGPYHLIEAFYPTIVINDKFEYEPREIVDEEFCELRKKRIDRS